MSEHVSSVSQTLLNKLHALGVGTLNSKTSEKEAEKPVAIPAVIREAKAVPELSEQVQKHNLEMAIDNQKYYLEMAAKNKNPHKVWFRNPKYEWQYSEFVLITPQMAQELLQHNNNIRNLSSGTMSAYARDIKSGLWFQTDESISIDLNGDMVNGQHRSEGIVQANVPVVMYVTWNVLPQSKFFQDSGKKRSVSDKLRLVVELPSGNIAAAICRAMMSGSSGRVKYSESEIAQFALKYQESIQWVMHNLPNSRADVLAALAKAYIWYGEPSIIDFCRRFKTMVFKSEKDPAALLYKRLTKMRSLTKGHVNGLAVYRLTLAAIDHEINNRVVSALYPREEDIFTWEKDWSLPAKG